MNNPGMFDAAWQEMLNNANMRVSTGVDASVNTDYVKVPIFHDFVDDFPDFHIKIRNTCRCKNHSKMNQMYRQVFRKTFSKNLIVYQAP